jgi:hypothetical protein
MLPLLAGGSSIMALDGEIRRIGGRLAIGGGTGAATAAGAGGTGDTRFDGTGGGVVLLFGTLFDWIRSEAPPTTAIGAGVRFAGSAEGPALGRNASGSVAEGGPEPPSSSSSSFFCSFASAGESAGGEADGDIGAGATTAGAGGADGAASGDRAGVLIIADTGGVRGA